MVRAFLVVLVFLVAVLAFVLDRTWLYAVSGVSLLTMLGWFALHGWNTYRRKERDRARSKDRREQRLEDFGIVAIRPQQKGAEARDEASARTSSDGEEGETPRPFVETPSDGRAAEGDASQRHIDDVQPAPSVPRPPDDEPRNTEPREASRPSSESGSSTTEAASEHGSDDGSPSNPAPHSSVNPSPTDEERTDSSLATSDVAESDRPFASDRSVEGRRTSVHPPADTRQTRAEAESGDVPRACSSTLSPSQTAGSAVDPMTTARSDDPVLTPLVESLRAATGAHSVCLLVQEDVVLEYEVRAISSVSEHVQQSGTFSTSDPLLTASMSRQPVTVRRIEGGRQVVAGYLRYYQTAPKIDHIALAPIPLRNTPTTSFLLVDATADGDLGAPQARTLIEQYAETASVILQSEIAASSDTVASETATHNPEESVSSDTGTPRVRESDPVSAGADTPPPVPGGSPPETDTPTDETRRGEARSSDKARSSGKAGAAGNGEEPALEGSSASHADNPPAAPDSPSADGEAADGEAADREASPRPRREIIAEEMKRADRDHADLALVLVHLNRAESIARRGPEAVAAAEGALQDRLYQAAPNQRVERFGELTYGVFYRGGLRNIEPWAVDLQKQMDGAAGTLEGGASIGVAVRSARHSGPESLRADATDALREAYKTGTCTIVQ